MIHVSVSGENVEASISQASISVPSHSSREKRIVDVYGYKIEVERGIKPSLFFPVNIVSTDIPALDGSLTISLASEQWKASKKYAFKRDYPLCEKSLEDPVFVYFQTVENTDETMGVYVFIENADSWTCSGSLSCSLSIECPDYYESSLSLN